EGEGYRVDGRLVDSAVEAPPALQALAEIERTRPDTGLFPMHLDLRGRIVAAAPAGASAGEPRRRAVEVANEALRRSALAPEEKTAAQAFIAQVAARGLTSPVPADLFRPVAGKRVETRRVPLPDGSEGEVTIEVQASVANAGGLLA